MYAYSFLDVNAAIVGPGGNFSLSGVGNSEEGIKVSFSEEKDTQTIGADGTPMHSLHASKGGKCTVSLLKTSPANQALSNLYNLQTNSSAAHGVNVISVANPVSGDSITLTQVAFAKHPDTTYAKEGGMMEWDFNVGVIDISLGGGIVANLATFLSGTV